MNIQIGGGMTILTIVLVVLKALEYIDWSWWWVFAPIWLPFALVLGFIALVFIEGFIVMGIMGLIYWIKNY